MIHLIFLANVILRVSTVKVELDGKTSLAWKKGDDVVLKCIASDATDVYWEMRTRKGTMLYQVLKNSTNSQTDFNSRIKWDWNQNKEKNTHFFLTIKSAERSDEGEYICRAGNKEVMKVTEPVTISIIYPGNEFFVSYPKDVYVVSGNTASIQCYVKDIKNEVTWLFSKKGTEDRKTLESTNEIFIGKKPKHYIFIEKVEKSNEGVYKCEITVEGKVYNQESILRVIDRAEGHVERHDRYPNAGQKNASIFCEGDANDRVAWIDMNLNVIMYDGVKVDDTNPSISFNPFEKRKLTFDGVSYMDSQSYYCASLDQPVWKEYILHIKGCPQAVKGESWKEVVETGECYGTLTQQELTFGESEIWCRQQGGHLVMPKTDEETTKITSLGFGDSFWIGLTDFEHEGLFRWLDGSALRTSQRRWQENEPNDANKQVGEDCVLLDSLKKKWKDIACNLKNKFVCETPNADWRRNKMLQEQRCPYGWIYFDCGGYCYKHSSVVKNWMLAKSYCNSVNGKLAMPKTQREHMFVLHTSLAMANEVWLGLTRSNFGTGHEWNDGQVEHWIYWGPSFSRLGYKCLVMSMKLYGRINARDCATELHFVCQMPQKTSIDLRSKDSKCGELALSSARKSSRRKRSINQGLRIGRVSHGENVEIEKFPWNVQLTLSTKAQCGGVLISPRHVLTAAHCLVNKTNDDILTKSDIQVVLGSDDTDLTLAGGRKEHVQMIKIYNDFDLNFRREANVSKLFERDLAIIEIARFIQTDCWKVRQVCWMAKDFEPPYKGYKCKFYGWGGGNDSLTHCDSSKSEIIGTEKNEIEVIQPDDCIVVMGDAGGPLACEKNDQWTLAAVMTSVGSYSSWGVRIGAEKFTRFIESIVQDGVKNEDRLYHETVCDKDEFIISCEYGRPPSIKIESAVYGRMTSKVCPSNNTAADKMAQKDVTKTLKTRCQWKNSCQFTVSPEIFGEAKDDKKKQYLEMTYKCQKHEMVVTSCENITKLECGVENYMVIEIQKARWGKSSKEICGGEKENPDCVGYDYKDMISLMCNGKMSCTIITTEELFGDVCFEFKEYFEVKYKCVYDSHLEIPDHVLFAKEDSANLTIAPNLILLLVLCTAAARLGN